MDRPLKRAPGPGIHFVPLSDEELAGNLRHTASKTPRPSKVSITVVEDSTYDSAAAPVTIDWTESEKR